MCVWPPGGGGAGGGQTCKKGYVSFPFVVDGTNNFLNTAV